MQKCLFQIACLIIPACQTEAISAAEEIWKELKELKQHYTRLDEENGQLKQQNKRTEKEYSKLKQEISTLKQTLKGKHYNISDMIS